MYINLIVLYAFLIILYTTFNVHFNVIIVMQKILILDNYDSFTYNLVHYVKAISNLDVDVYRNDKISLQEIEKYNTIILSPGPGLPKDAGILFDVIKTFAPTKKILGVCLGMQAIGEVFGGNLINLNKVFHGIATSINVTDQTDLLFKNLAPKFNVGRYHSWVINNEKFPADLKITATDEDSQIMAIKHNKFNLYGVQFHPESILTENGKELLANFLAVPL